MNHAARLPSGHATPARNAALWSLAILSIATSVIHFAVAGEHFAEYWLFGVFMLVTAWLQLLFAVAAIAWPSRLALGAGAVLNTGIIAVYIVTRTVGDVIGPTPHAVEPFGFGDGLCTVLEAIVVAGCLWLLAVRLDQQLERRQLGMTAAAVGTMTAILLSVALVDGGPEMVMGMSVAAPADAPGGARAGAPAAWPRHRSNWPRSRLPATSPCPIRACRWRLA